MTCGWPRPPVDSGSFTPAKSGSFDVTGTSLPPFGIHHALSPVFMLYAVTPPSFFGLKIETPPIVVPVLRPSKPPRPAPVGWYPAGAGSAPILPQLSCGEL